MNTTRDIVVLCNNRMAFPAIQTLHSLGRLHTIGVPAENEDVKAFCSVFAAKAGINLIWIEKSKLEVHLQEIIKNTALKFIFTIICEVYLLSILSKLLFMAFVWMPQQRLT